MSFLIHRNRLTVKGDVFIREGEGGRFKGDREVEREGKGRQWEEETDELGTETRKSCS